jgi:AcrR family transcriptional regulator
MSAPAKLPPQAMPVDAPIGDGRVKRSVVTRKKIVDALTALIEEGHLSPTAEQVATRAEVGLRTVFRHFDDMDSLYREMSRDIDAKVLPLVSMRLGASSWQERLLQSLDLRTQLYDRVAAVHLATQVHRHESAYLSGNVMRMVELQRELLRRLLPDALTRNATVFEALDLILSIESWVRLRREQGLSAADSRQVMRRCVAGILSTQAADEAERP